jgi:hypothetical protein
VVTPHTPLVSLRSGLRMYHYLGAFCVPNRCQLYNAEVDKWFRAKRATGENPISIPARQKLARCFADEVTIHYDKVVSNDDCVYNRILVEW